MKTITQTTVLIATALLISINVMASGTQFETEAYIDDIPFNLDSIETQVRFEEAVSVDFSFAEEEFISDMSFTQNDLDEMNNYHRALAEDFDFEEEEYIDDVPFLCSDAASKSNKLYAVSL